MKDYRALRGAAGILAVVFLYSAAVQYNDPDPVRWMLLYAAAVVIVGGSVLRPVPRVASLALALVAGLWAAALFPDVMSGGAPSGSEQERELMGLLLVVVGAAVSYARSPGPILGFRSPG